MIKIPKREYINVQKTIKKILPDKLIKDLSDGERICSHCGGLGVVAIDTPYGIRDEWKTNTPRFPYTHQTLTFCPCCYNGVQKLCKYCGKPYKKGNHICNCKEYEAEQIRKAKEKRIQTIKNAECIDVSNVTTMLYCEENDRYYDNIDEFIEDWECNYSDETMPEILWVTDETSISLDAYNIVSYACEELHEEAYDNCDCNALQELLDDWCLKQTGATTYYPSSKKYVKVPKCR